VTQTARLAQVLLPLVVAACGPALAGASEASLPFVAVSSDQEIFASSHLTRTYAPDRTYILSAPQLRRTELARLDRWGWFPADDVPAPDDSETGRVAQQTSPAPEELVPADELRADQPAQAGVHVGIPSVVAATGAALGGLVLLVQVLAGLF
jgi:hypothetical protein